ncbi:hypothetical protein RFF05_05485 [Bengtsoniella intestinalis]|uniref:hypothetical protein n=1 Tax=Bengtsoniella intestinalis TaxID=3073143 RepID=UPI00391F90E2
MRITGIANFLEAFPSFVAKLVLRYKMKPTLSDYVENLLKGLEYHAVTGKKIQKNQFGGHKMFSPSDV